MHLSLTVFLKVTFKRWVSTDRTALDTSTMPAEEFVQFFFQLMFKLRSHFYINREQQAALRKRKENLREGEVILGGDFSENYSSLLQVQC